MISTLNAAVARLKKIIRAHRQVRSVYQGEQSDWINDKRTLYPSALLEYSGGGTLSLQGHQVTLGFSLILADRQDRVSRTDENLLDVQSDMIEVAKDLVAQFNDPRLDDWIISADNNVQLFSQSEGDYLAGAIITFSVSLIWGQNLCAVPTDLVSSIPIEAEGMKAYDTTYVVAGNEGSTIVVPTVDLAKVLFVTRENAIMYEVNTDPDEAEYVVSGTTITFGTPLTAGERILILYRTI
jgi:hypothetical protein